jgi:hypothetical protein
MQEDKFTTVPFPEDTDIVYVLKYRRPGELNLIPFYVGESGRGTRRIGEYVSAQFAAATDFKVGVAVRAFRAKGCDVFVSHQESTNRRADETELINRYTQLGHKLLNAVPSYNYKSAEKSAEQARIERFVIEVLQATTRGPSPSAAFQETHSK